MAGIADLVENLMNERIEQGRALAQASADFQAAQAQAKAAQVGSAFRAREGVDKARFDQRKQELQRAKLEQQERDARDAGAEVPRFPVQGDPTRTLSGPSLSAGSSGSEAAAVIQQLVEGGAGVQSQGGGGGQPQPEGPANTDPNTGRRFTDVTTTGPISTDPRTLLAFGAMKKFFGVGPGAFPTETVRQPESVEEFKARIEPRALGFSTVLADVHSGNAPPDALTFEAQNLVQELGPAGAREVVARGTAQWREQRMKQSIEESKPQYKLAKMQLRIAEKVESGGIGSLNPGEKALFKHSQKGTTVNVGELTKATRSKIEQSVDATRGLLSNISGIRGAFFKEGLQRFSGVERTVLAEKVRNGLATEADRAKLDRYANFDQQVNALKADRVRAIAGATMTAYEIQLAEGYIPTIAQDEVTFTRNLDNFQYDLGASLFRHEQLLNAGIPDPRFAMPLADAKKMAAEVARGRLTELEAGGMDSERAGSVVRQEFLDRYGLDTGRLFQNEKPQ